MIEGYNIRLKLNSKTLLAETQGDINVTPQLKESITKDDAGTKQEEVTGQEITFSVSGLVELKGNNDTSHLDVDDLLEQSLKKGSAAEIPFVYYRGATAKSYSGTCVMTGYSESAPADPDSDTTWSADFKVKGAMTVVTQ